MYIIYFNQIFDFSLNNSVKKLISIIFTIKTNRPYTCMYGSKS